MTQTKVKSWRAGNIVIVHVGRYVRKDWDGSPLYRLACQGRNARYYTRAEQDQSVAVTCQRCA